MPTPISAIPNLGPATEAAFAGGHPPRPRSCATLARMTPISRCCATGTRPHFIGYYVLVMGLQGRPWNDCQGEEKAALRVRFDALKAQAQTKGRSELEAALDSLGVVERRASAASIFAENRARSADQFKTREEERDLVAPPFPARPSRGPSSRRSTARIPCGWCHRRHWPGWWRPSLRGSSAMAPSPSSTCTTTGSEAMNSVSSPKKRRSLCTA